MRTLPLPSLVGTTLLFVATGSFAQPAPAQPAPAQPAPAAAPPAPAQPAAPAEAAQPAPAEAAPAAPAAPAEPAPAAAPPPAPAAAAPAAPPVEEKKPEEKKPDHAEKIPVGEQGYFKPGLNIQAWYQFHDEGEKAKDAAITNMFKIRRAEIKGSGEIFDKLVKYEVMIDPAKALEFDPKPLPVDGQTPAPTTAGTVTAQQPTGKAVTILQDANITFVSEYVDVTFGQAKNPISWEGYNSATALILPERALVSRLYGDFRDIGLKVSKKFDYVMYWLGIYNGSGTNRLDSNDQKDLALRLEVYPIKELTIGLVGYQSLGESDETTTRTTLEGDVRLDISNFLLQAEYIRNRQDPNGADVTGHGLYGAIGYTFLDKIQPVIRVGMLDPNTDSAKDQDDTVAIEGGVNYFVLPKNEVKLQLSYARFIKDEIVATQQFSAHEITLAGQVKF